MLLRIAKLATFATVFVGWYTIYTYIEKALLHFLPLGGAMITAGLLALALGMLLDMVWEDYDENSKG